MALALLLAVLVAACTREESIPPDVLPPEKMVSILTDVHLLESKVNFVNVDQDSARALFDEQQELLYEKHGVNDSIFNHSFEYYLKRVELMDKIYGAVVDSLSLRRNVETSKEEESRGSK